MKINQKLRKAIRLGLSTALIAGGGAYSINAMAMPSFARQTGWSCATCHTGFPQLTPMGRMFKLLGYTTNNVQAQQKIQAKLGKQTALLLMRLSQFSVFIQAGYGTTHGGGNPTQGNFPHQVSVFYAGEITPTVGTFMHFTLDGGTGGFGMDDSDIRWAKPWAVGPNGSDLLITGVYATNTPTETDVYNSMPDWNAPFSGVKGVSTSSPGGSTLLDAMAGAGGPIAGLGGYLTYIWGQNRSNWLYVAAADFGDANNGTGTNPVGGFGVEGSPGGKMDGTMPYLRVAYQHDWGNWNAEVGALWSQAKIYVNSSGLTGSGPGVGPYDKYADTGLQTQIQWLDTLNNNNLTILGSYIREQQNIYNSSNQSVTGNQGELNLNATYWYHDMYGAQAGYVNVTESHAVDPGAAQTGYWLQASWQPWYNLRISGRYTGYTKYSGTSGNASDADTYSLLAWLAY